MPLLLKVVETADDMREVVDVNVCLKWGGLLIQFDLNLNATISGLSVIGPCFLLTW